LSDLLDTLSDQDILYNFMVLLSFLTPDSSEKLEGEIEVKESEAASSEDNKDEKKPSYQFDSSLVNFVTDIIMPSAGLRLVKQEADRQVK